MVGGRATYVETLNTTVEAMRAQVEGLAKKAQVEGLATAVNNLAYSTMASYCNEARTNKGTTLLSLSDGDGFLVDIHQARLWPMEQLAFH
jgi:hypothetical protein